MPEPMSLFRRGLPVRAALVALIVVAVAAVVFVVVRDGRRTPTTATAPTPAPSGTAATTGSSTTQASSPSGTVLPSDAAAATPSCAPGQSGPLRQDAEFQDPSRGGAVVRYSISLPDDYWTACKAYPVVYALHGRDQDHAGFLDDALTMRAAMTAGVLEQAVIVTPDGYRTGRWENRDTGPAEDDFIASLIPYVERTYRVRPGAAYRLLVGFSMGGHGALRFGLKYPQLFAAVWSVDGAMADNDSYLGFVDGRTSADFRILAVGGRLNGDRVSRVVDALKGRGIELPYTYEDVDHDFRIFVAQDQKLGWPAMTYLQRNLGRPM